MFNKVIPFAQIDYRVLNYGPSCRAAVKKNHLKKSYELVN